MAQSFGNCQLLYKAHDYPDVISIVCGMGDWLADWTGQLREHLVTHTLHLTDTHPLPGARIKYQSVMCL